MEDPNLHTKVQRCSNIGLFGSSIINVAHIYHVNPWGQYKLETGTRKVCYGTWKLLFNNPLGYLLNLYKPLTILRDYKHEWNEIVGLAFDEELTSNIPGDIVQHCCSSLSSGISEANSLSEVSQIIICLFKTVQCIQGFVISWSLFFWFKFVLVCPDFIIR